MTRAQVCDLCGTQARSAEPEDAMLAVAQVSRICVYQAVPSSQAGHDATTGLETCATGDPGWQR
jgi:hypothetical protein